MSDVEIEGGVTETIGYGKFGVRPLEGVVEDRRAERWHVVLSSGQVVRRVRGTA